MSWFGKIMGGSVGFMMGGPIGALIGVSLGHALIDDKARAGMILRLHAEGAHVCVDLMNSFTSHQVLRCCLCP